MNKIKVVVSGGWCLASIDRAEQMMISNQSTGTSGEERAAFPISKGSCE